ncbi:unnamed protein product [Urochloa decumbens]|uniref:Uncharacterized protein n=1 Tax=Urochloa decumbens TaxID=240449 RepID=A0ABC9AN96_9POAL
MERLATVTATTGALGPVLAKLAALLGGEYELQEGTRRDIVSIKSDLEPVHDLLEKSWGWEDLDAAYKDWMAEARELSYDLENGIDGFTLGLERGDSGFIQREATDSPFKKFTESVKGVSKRCCEMQKIGDAICNRSKLNTDPRDLFFHKDASELVGMEEKKEELIKLLQKHEMVCIVGSAGMGKTTVADLVYREWEDAFHCRAFVSMHPSPNTMEILDNIRSQITNSATSAGSGTEPAVEQDIINDISISLSDKSDTEPGAKEHIINNISIFLSEKRYLVIIDGIWRWDEWEVIRKALPKNNLGSKIIMTTRINGIAEKCQSEQGAHVYRYSFGYWEAIRLSEMTLKNKSEERGILEANAKDLHSKIVDMCEAVPLAVICLCSAWAEGGYGPEWDTWVSHLLMDSFLTTPSLKPLVDSLSLGFEDLPVHLRTCFLYCSVYPRGYFIEKHCLIRKWIAEGFVSQEKVAEDYLDKLVSRSLLQPERVENIYRVHPLMLAFLASKAKEDNFVAYEDVSHTRSLVVLGLDGVPFTKFKHLRVLEIDRCSEGLENVHLVDICGMIWLRYLALRGCDRITELPQEIARLQHLETLDVSHTPLRKLPMEIRELQRLKTVDIRNTEVNELSWIFPNSLTVRAGATFSVQEVSLPQEVNPFPDSYSYGDGDVWRKELSIVFFISRPQVVPVPRCKVARRHLSIPLWVRTKLLCFTSLDIRLCKLEKMELDFLKGMPELKVLALRFEIHPRAPIAITGGGFSKLEAFFVDCRLPRVITFEPEAMPEVKYLEFKFYTGTVSQDYSMGIMHLPKLEKVVFRCSEHYTDDSQGISATIDDVRKEAIEHPNVITLLVNGKKEVLGSGRRWISRARKAITEKEIEDMKKDFEKREMEIEKREREIDETVEHIDKQCSRILNAALGRSQPDKDDAKARIQEEIQERMIVLESRERRLSSRAAERRRAKFEKI